MLVLQGWEVVGLELLLQLHALEICFTPFDGMPGPKLLSLPRVFTFLPLKTFGSHPQAPLPRQCREGHSSPGWHLLPVTRADWGLYSPAKRCSLEVMNLLEHRKGPPLEVCPLVDLLENPKELTRQQPLCALLNSYGSEEMDCVLDGKIQLRRLQLDCCCFTPAVFKQLKPLKGI